MDKRLYDSHSIMYILSAIMRKPSLLEEPSFILTEADFIDPLHKIVFGSVFNLASESVEHITPMNVDLYLKQFQQKYDYYQKNGGLEYLVNIYDAIDIAFEKSEFNLYYQRIKKFTILRDLQKHGFDIKQFYDADATLELEKQNEKLNSIELNQIFETIKTKLAIIEDAHINKTIGGPKNAGEGLRDLFEELKTTPEYGNRIDGEIFNSITRGAREGKMFLYSAPSGHGKTRFFVGNACALSLPYIEEGKVIVGENLVPVLFVATEMDVDEIQTLILAYVSGVNENKILTNNLSPKEEFLIEHAIKIIEQYSENFKIEKISDPNITTLRTKLVRYVMADNYRHIFYDYIFTTTSLNAEFSKTGLREDVVLMMLSNTLKELASTYGAFIYTGTQVSRGWEKAQFRNENFIAGSKAIGDKVDFGAIAIRLLEEEKKQILPILEAQNIQEMPNLVIDIYKNRRGEVTNAKLFRNFNYGTCRARDILLTDTNYSVWPFKSRLNYSEREYDINEFEREVS